MTKGGFAALAIGALVALAVGTLAFHLRFSPVLTGSMRPSFAPGSVIITKPVNVHSLRAGDVAVFVPPGESERYAHRVTSVTTIGDKVVITTKGDANPAPDAWRAQLNGTTVPKVVATVPLVGRPITWLHTRWLHAAAIAALGLLFTAIGTTAILRSPGRREALT